MTIKSKPASKEYRSGWDETFGKKKENNFTPEKLGKVLREEKEDKEKVKQALNLDTKLEDI